MADLAETSAFNDYELSPLQRQIWASSGDFPIQHSVLQLDASLQEARAACNELCTIHSVLRAQLRVIPGLKTPRQFFADDQMPLWLADTVGCPLVAAKQAISRQTESPPVVIQKISEAQASLITGKCLSWPNRLTLLISIPWFKTDSMTPTVFAKCLDSVLAGQLDAQDPLAFEDYLQWQESVLRDPEGAPDRDMARQALQRLDEEMPTLSLGMVPADGVDAADSSYAITVDAPDAACAALRDCLATVEGVEYDALLAAVWLVTLWRLGDRDPQRVGLPLDLRQSVEDLAETVGPLTAPFAFAIDLQPHSSILDVARDIMARCAAAAEWTEFYATCESLGPLHSSFETVRPYVGNRCALVWQSLACTDASLRAHCELDPETMAIRLSLGFGPEAIEKPSLAVVARSYMALLSAALQHPDTGIGQLSILDIEDRDFYRSLYTPLPPAPPSSPSMTLLQAFYTQLDRNDGLAIAVKAGDAVIDYAELNRRASEIAATLADHNFTEERIVAVALQRGTDMVAAILACAKADIVYTPLDPTNAAARMAYQLEHSGAELLVIDRLTLEQLQPSVDAGRLRLPSVTVTDDLKVAPKDVARFSHSTPTSGSTAYVVYTSGSTGRPKGVAVGHDAVAVYLRAASERLGWSDGDIFATVSTIAADLGNTVIMGSLYCGGTLHVMDYETATSGEAFATYCQAHALDVLKIVPSHFQSLWQSVARDQRQNLLPRQLVFGGEILPPELVEEILQTQPECQIFNHYGPTETTVGVLMAAVRSADNGSIALGRSNPGTAMMLCDRAGEPVPSRCKGELYLGGMQLAEGYWRQDALSRERFVNALFFRGDATLGDTSRWYRSGDRVWFDERGICHYAGRCDLQVKIRGYRVELGEIEQAIGRLEGVRSAIVDYRSNGGERQDDVERSLVAYVVMDDGAHMNILSLRSHLKNQLPDYMLPRHLVLLKRLPLNRNGKVDRIALPDPVADQDKNVLSPRYPLEAVLVEMFEAVLGLDKISVMDDFFALGGHSLAAVKVSAMIRQRLCPQLETTALFDYSSVAALAAYIREQQFSPADDGVSSQGFFVPLNAEQPDVLLCVASNTRKILLYQPLAKRLAGKIHVLVLDPHALVWSSRLRPSSIDGILASGTVFGDALQAYLKERFPAGVRSLNVLGWSFGGVIAQQLAATIASAQKINALTIVDSRLETRDPQIAADPLLRYIEHLPESARGVFHNFSATQHDQWRKRIASAPAGDAVGEALAIAKEQGLFDDGTGYSPDDMREYIEAQEHFHQLVANHSVAAVDVPLTIIWAGDTLKGWKERGKEAPDWAALCGVKASVYTVDSAHDSILATDALLDLVSAMLMGESAHLT